MDFRYRLLVFLDLLLVLAVFRRAPTLFGFLVLLGLAVAFLSLFRRALRSRQGRSAILVCALILSSTVFFFISLRPIKFVGDESWDYIVMAHKAAYEPGFRERWRQRHYFYPIVLSASQTPNKVFGWLSHEDRIFSMRLFHLVFSVMLGFVSFYLFARSLFDHDTGIVFCILFFTCYMWFEAWWGVFHIMLDGVFLGVYFLLLYCLFFLNDSRSASYSGILTGVLFLLKYQSTWILPSVFLYVVFFRRDRVRYILGFLASLFVVFLVFLVVEQLTYGGPAHSFRVAAKNHSVILEGKAVIDYLSKDFTAYFRDFRWVFPSRWVLPVLAAGFLSTAWLERMKSRRLLAFLAPYCAILFFYPVVDVRFTFPVVALLMLFTARAVTLAYSRSRILGVFLAFAVLSQTFVLDDLGGIVFSDRRGCAYNDDGVVLFRLLDELDTLPHIVRVGSVTPIWYPPHVFYPHSYRVAVEGWVGLDQDGLVERMSGYDYVVFSGFPGAFSREAFIRNLSVTHDNAGMDYCQVSVYRRRGILD